MVDLMYVWKNFVSSQLLFVLVLSSILPPIIEGEISLIERGQDQVKLEEDLYGSLTNEEIRSNIATLYQAKLRAERANNQDPLAALAEELSANAKDYSCIVHKMNEPQVDLMYDNRTDFAKELKFSPNNYNCGKQFDIAKLLVLVRKYSKLKPYTIGADAADLDLQVHRIGNKDDKNNDIAQSQLQLQQNNTQIQQQLHNASIVPQPQTLLNKDMIFKSNFTTQSPVKNNWWLSGGGESGGGGGGIAAHKNSPPHLSKAQLPTKNITNTNFPNLNEPKYNKISNEITSPNTLSKPQILSQKTVIHTNVSKLQKVHKSFLPAKDNLKQISVSKRIQAISTAQKEQGTKILSQQASAQSTALTNNINIKDNKNNLNINNEPKKMIIQNNARYPQNNILNRQPILRKTDNNFVQKLNKLHNSALSAAGHENTLSHFDKSITSVN